MKFGLNPDQFQILETLLILPLKKKECEIWVFGSRARGDQHPYSDIDILYSAPTKGLPSNFIGQIKEELENSNLTIKVDLVDIDNLADSYKKNVFKDRIKI